jgi:hypothetical protein
MDMIEQAFVSAIFHADRDASPADCITPADVVAGAIIDLWASGLPRRDIEAIIDCHTVDGEPRPIGDNVVPFRRRR